MTDIIAYITENYVQIFAAAGAVVSAATLVTALTPTKKDDAVVTKIRKALDIIATLAIRLGK